MGRHLKLLKLKNMKRANRLMEAHLLKEAPGMPLWRICGPNEQGGFTASDMGGLPTGMVVSFFISASTSWYSNAPLTPAGTINTDPFSPTVSLVNSEGVNHQTAADVMAGLDHVEDNGCTGISINSPSVGNDPSWAGVQFSGFQTFCAEYLGYGDIQASGAFPLVYPPATSISNSWVSSPVAGSSPGDCTCCDYIPNIDPRGDDEEEWDPFGKTKTQLTTNTIKVTPNTGREMEKGMGQGEVRKPMTEWDTGKGGKTKLPNKGIKNWGCLFPDASNYCPNCTLDCEGNPPGEGSEGMMNYAYDCCDFMLSDPDDMALAPDKGKILKPLNEEIKNIKRLF